MRTCSNGHSNPDESNFCGDCGEYLAPAEQTREGEAFVEPDPVVEGGPGPTAEFGAVDRSVDQTTTPAAWYSDPLGRFDERYWDGFQWTARIRMGRSEGTDPMGIETEDRVAYDRAGRAPSEPPASDPLAPLTPSSANPSTAPPAPPAGFYPDPDGRFAERYWDGGEWTSQTRMGASVREEPLGDGPNPIPAEAKLPPSPEAWKTPAMPPSRSRAPLLLAVLAGVVLLVLVGAVVVALGSGGDGSHTIKGRLLLLGYESSDSTGGACYGVDGYDDLEGGAQVRVKNEDGKIIGTGALDEGRYTNSDDDVCRFIFDVPDVSEANVYTIEISRRGELSWPAAEMEEMDWTVSTTIGDFD